MVFVVPCKATEIFTTQLVLLSQHIILNAFML